MAQTPFFCDECHMGLDEWNVRNHISAMHLNYFPYKCFACKGKGINYETLSAELMYEHSSTVHVGAVPDVRLFMDREGELNAAVDNCRRPTAEQVSLTDSKHAIRQVFISLADTLTDTRNDAIENEVTSTEIKQENDSVEVHESPNNDNIGEDTELNEIESPILQIPSTEPAAIVETQQNAYDPITTSDNTSAMNAVPLAKPEPPESVSTVPIGLQLEARLSSYVPIDDEAQHNSVVIPTGRASRISRRKRNNVSSNSIESPERSFEYVLFDFRVRILSATSTYSFSYETLSIASGEDEGSNFDRSTVTSGSLNTTTGSKRRKSASAFKDQTEDDLQAVLERICKAAKSRFEYNPNTTVEKLTSFANELENREKWGNQLAMDPTAVKNRERARKNRAEISNTEKVENVPKKKRFETSPRGCRGSEKACEHA
ncbi:hypothetical protein DdX_19965 [Ditylenchus destructor]|uniref:C2H2-type domain-containing protein n=1 Tax=Ditylenchus destructor TaxID=166010 RepID=A0AAD4QWU2_9BILA|nr:hypothetical protein DdX_19965 [Ditylenchus destructor]